MTTFAFTSGDPSHLSAAQNASMADIQGPFVDLRTFLNGNISDVNLSASAAITEAKLAVGSSGLAKGAFSAYLNSAQTLTATVATKVNLNAEDFDVSGWFDTTNGRYTPQVAGYYRFSGAILFAAGPASGNYVIVNLYKNGAQYKRLAQLFTVAVATGVGVPFSSPPVAFNGTTDFVELWATSEAGQGMTTGSINTYLGGELIGRS